VTVPRRRLTLAAARRASGHTQESLASALHVDRSTIVRWESGERTPLPYLQPKLARLLGQSPEQLRALVSEPGSGLAGDAPTSRETQSSADFASALDWLDQHAEWPPGTSRRRVTSRLAKLNADDLRERNVRRTRVNRSQIVEALSVYYSTLTSDGDDYRVRCAGREFATGMVSRPGWLDLACPLTPNTDRLTLASSVLDDDVILDDIAAKHAVDRLAEAAALDVRITNAPIYRLVDIDTAPAGVGGSVGLTPFVRYALTMDLLERELVDAVAAGVDCRPGSLPLRDRHLPDFSSIVDVSGRLCAGGALALCAIARPADPYRGAADYALLVQERSGLVLNMTRRLSVIPKGFHEPLTDVRADVPLGATLRREMEEELFGRSDVDNTRGEPRVAAPMHPSRLSEPMRWLMEDPNRLRMECTGFGLNMVSGNYEFAGLIVIEDEEFWSRFGGHIEANWESAGLRQYSSLDCQTVTELIAHESWSSEGLFALLLGIRRLMETGGTRVNLPTIG
jgi:transcriptional regulator with XRE-family HTH domain